eukprot:3431176-Alexandrium_andersonii.AAC.1
MSAQEHRDWWANKAKPSDASPAALPAPCAVARPDSTSDSDDESECSTRFGGGDASSDSGDDDWASPLSEEPWETWANAVSVDAPLPATTCG